MHFKINSSIASQISQSYAIEGEDSFKNIDIDCAEGINIVSFSDKAIDAFNSIDYTIMKDYPHSLDIKKSIIKFWKEYTNVDLTNDNIILSDGSIASIYLVNRLFLEKGDKVLGLAPQFPEFKTDTLMYGCDFTSYVLKEENNYKFLVDEFIQLIDDDFKIIYIDNPNNPTGQIIPINEIERILKVAYDKDIVVIIDEAYGDYMDSKNSSISLTSRFENLIVLKTFSKGYGLAGLRGGYTVLNENLSTAIKKITTPYNMTSVTRAVASKVIDDYKFLEDLRDINASMKKQLIKPYKNLSIAENGETVSIMMITHKNKNLDLKKEFEKLKIAVISGGNFDSIGKNSVRFRLPSPKFLPQLINAFEIIDNIE